MQSNQNSFINLIAKDGFSVVFGRFYGAMDKASKSATNMGSSVRNAFASFAVGGAAYKATSTIVNLNLEFDRINRTLTFANQSTMEGAKAFAFIREESRRLGLDLKTTAAAYAQFAAAARGTSLEGQKARDIFSAVSGAATVLGLDAYSTRGALRALEQMISKGNVQAEELRQQLGERLPGAFQKAAKAMGVTTSELNDMLENGEVLAEDLLPKLTKVLNQDFGASIAEASESLRGDINRFRTETDLLINNVDGLLGFSKAFEFIVESITAGEKSINNFIESAGQLKDQSLMKGPSLLRDAINEVQNEINELESAGGAGFYELSIKYDTLTFLNSALETAVELKNALLGGGPARMDMPEPPKGRLSVTPMDEGERLTKLGEMLDSLKTPQEKYNEAAKQLAIVFGPDIIKHYDKYLALLDIEKQKLFETTKEYRDQVEEEARLNQLKKDAAGVIESLMTPQESYRAEVAHLKEMHDSGALSLDQYTQAVRNAGMAMVELLPETIAVNEAQNELQGIFDSLKTPTERYADELMRIIELFNTLKEAKDGSFEAMGGEEGMVALMNKLAQAFSANRQKIEEEAFATQLAAAANITTILDSTDQAIQGLQGAFEQGSGIAKAFFLITQSVAAANAIVKGYEAKMSIIAAYAKLGFPGSETIGKVQGNLALMAGFASAGAIMGQTIASFEGGGYTGSGARVGGMDGKGGMLAMVHPNETIIDHEKNGKMAQPVNVSFNIQANDTKDFDRLLIERRGVIVSLINNAVNNRGRRLVE